LNMAQPDQNDQTRSVRKSALAALAGLYMFPQQDKALAAALQKRFPGLGVPALKDSLHYLQKKGYVAFHKAGKGPLGVRITPLGIDLVDGAVNDQGVLPTRPDFAGLMAKRAVRMGILSYCRQFPESCNGDDEIHADLVDQGMERLLADEVRFHIWYLAGKGYLEMKSHQVNNDVACFARITALGMDLADGVITDPGVTTDE